jgi:hypothetical protein
LQDEEDERWSHFARSNAQRRSRLRRRQRKPAADEREADAELAGLVKARQHERRITVTLDEL